ncbi:MAG: hypothetical protein KKC03_13935 [Bacteroidetes bacterium]|nr:hypothetical protein [Bacteroidota bacterium]
MTQNEKIAEVMGNAGFKYFDEWDELKQLWLAKLLQARMVADGWYITNLQWGIDKFCAWAKKSYVSSFTPNDDLKHSPDCISEPAALVSLFCKVFNIEGEK